MCKVFSRAVQCTVCILNEHLPENERLKEINTLIQDKILHQFAPHAKKTNRCQTIFNSSPFARGSLQEYIRKMKPFPPLLISPRPPVDRTLLSKVSSLSQILWNARRKCSVRIVSCRHFSKVKFVRAATTPAKEDQQIKCSQNRAVQ